MSYLNRKLGLVENLFEILHDLGAMIEVNAAQIEGPLTPTILQKALDLVQKRHPMLQVHMVGLADGTYFQSEGTSKIPLRVIDKQHENQWLEITEEELHQQFFGGVEPLCRVTLISPFTSNGISEIIVTFHHAIIDGLSCINFIHELLAYCQQIADEKQIPEIATMQLLPPLENLLGSNLNSQKFEDYQEKIDREILTSKLIIESEALASQRRTHLINRIISQEMTLKLKEVCKQEKTTIHGALCAAMLLGTAKIAFPDLPVTLSCGSSVNVRKLCVPEVNHEYIGDFALAVTENHTLEKTTSFWNLARECKSKISCSISRGFPIRDKLLNINKDLMIKISEHQMGRKETVHISNLGQVKFCNEYELFKIKSLYFAPGIHLVGACLWLGLVTFNEKLFCSFAHVVPIVSTQTAELLADSAIATMEKACIDKLGLTHNYTE